tara:strand:+ start:18266 stop:18454 length:189 start_codon:yes stop_codon:yes gene_type:complete
MFLHIYHAFINLFGSFLFGIGNVYFLSLGSFKNTEEWIILFQTQNDQLNIDVFINTLDGTPE